MQSGGRLRQLRDDYDTASEQARFSQSRVKDLEQGLEQRIAEDLLPARTDAEVIEDRFVEAVCRAEGEEFFNVAQEELEVANAYASGVRIILTTQKEEVIERGLWLVDDVELARAVEGVVAAASQAQEDAVSTELLRTMMEEHGNAVERIEELENIVDKLEEDRGQLEADLDLARRQYQAVSHVFENLEAVHSCTRRDLASLDRVVARLEQEINVARSGAVNEESGPKTSKKILRRSVTRASSSRLARLQQGAGKLRPPTKHGGRKRRQRRRMRGRRRYLRR